MSASKKKTSMATAIKNNDAEGFHLAYHDFMGEVVKGLHKRARTAMMLAAGIQIGLMIDKQVYKRRNKR